MIYSNNGGEETTRVEDYYPDKLTNRSKKYIEETLDGSSARDIKNCNSSETANFICLPKL